MDLAAAGMVLPRGVFDTDGGRHRDVSFAALTGREELVLAGIGRSPTPSDVSRLLATCLVRVGGYAPVTEGLAASLSRGDRVVALLGLRRALFGERVSLVLRCPSAACRELADLDIQVSQLLPDADVPEILEVETPAGPATLRPPTGVDDAIVVASDLPVARASALLWSRIILDLAGDGPITPEDWAALTAPTRLALGQALAASGGEPDLALVTACPECGVPYAVVLDPATLLMHDVGGSGERLLAEVHALAFHYHWSEAEILGLPRDRRWTYLELLRQELSGRPS